MWTFAPEERASDTAQRSHELLNSYVRFRPVYDWSHSEGVEAALYYLKRSRLLSRTFRRMHEGEVVALCEEIDHLEADVVPVARIFRARIAQAHNHLLRPAAVG